MTLALTRTVPPARAAELVARTVRVDELDAGTRDAAFALFDALYEGSDRARFDRDLAEKHRVILLRDRDTGALKGFSTLHLRTLHDLPGRPTVVFSGDTVVDRACWGQKQLQAEWVRVMLRLKLRHPHRPLYWFLISKGYRTYLLLANAFPRAVPRHDRADLPRLRAALDRVAAERFGGEYDPASSRVLYRTPHERVRDGVAPVDDALLRNPHVRFFVQRNPGHARGEELACLADVRLGDLLRVVGRVLWSRARR
ncbi:MAG: hypothetical protein AVDCRST_MAG68-1896 [uncultured Gemmatimonadetes bacterium]|uniref:Uncharacterized protein n=1 Tax=uncultured Gemmatimonadota bacterium TaxID=203437 RepID=A0A6J4KZR1_9BACT|nr:MAG: hypothetical protein AVDCRST_MAG68-1896 [uncultured Gemmatimonadota bacterium]